MIFVLDAYVGFARPRLKQKPSTERLRDFNRLEARWDVRRRKLKTRLANSQNWVELTGTCVNWPTLARDPESIIRALSRSRKTRKGFYANRS
jgi:hypothetical protein